MEPSRGSAAAGLALASVAAGLLIWPGHAEAWRSARGGLNSTAFHPSPAMRQAFRPSQAFRPLNTAFQSSSAMREAFQPSSAFGPSSDMKESFANTRRTPGTTLGRPKAFRL